MIGYYATAANRQSNNKKSNTLCLQDGGKGKDFTVRLMMKRILSNSLSSTTVGTFLYAQFSQSFSSLDIFERKKRELKTIRVCSIYKVVIITGVLGNLLGVETTYTMLTR
jgi:hypothetical protein